MKMIKNARLYHVEFPRAAELAERLEEHAFREISTQQLQTSGFVPCLRGAGGYVECFPSGFSFTLRTDTRLLPGPVVQKELQDRIRAIENEEGRKVGRKEKAELKETVIFGMIPRAFVRTSLMECFYSADDKLLVVPSASAAKADEVIAHLLKACGSLRTSTIWVDAISQGLTGRLKTAVDAATGHAGEDDPLDPFDGFSLGGFVRLKRQGEKVTFDLEDQDSSGEAIREALDHGFLVDCIELGMDNALWFKVDDKFTLRSVQYPDVSDDGEFETWEEQWAHEASVQFLSVRAVIDRLKAMFGYEEPETEAPESDDLI